MKSISQALSRASCALLGVTAPATAVAAEPWDIDLGLMNYIEQDRTTGIELLARARRELGDGDEFHLGAEVDTLAGATPNGASTSNRVQTFTRPSGAASYRVAAGKLPVVDPHGDTRVALRAGYTDLRDSHRIDYDGHLSMEFDYFSVGFGNAWQKDFDRGNTSVSLGFNIEHNRVHPVGDIPQPMALMTPPGSFQNRGAAADNRNVVELGIGLSQVVSRRSLFQLRLARTRFEGYLNDPYKLLSVVDDQAPASLGETVEYRFENRPEERQLDSIYFAWKQDTDPGVLDASLRLSSDDWGIDASAVDLRFRYRLAESAYLQPHLRLYRQSAADFFRYNLVTSEALPAHASPDHRLAAFDGLTLGLKYGFRSKDGNRHSIAAEYYTQQGDGSPASAVGAQRDLDLFPPLKSLIFRYLFKLSW